MNQTNIQPDLELHQKARKFYSTQTTWGKLNNSVWHAIKA